MSSSVITVDKARMIDDIACWLCLYENYAGMWASPFQSISVLYSGIKLMELQLADVEFPHHPLKSLLAVASGII